jgi:hypothetical protein
MKTNDDIDKFIKLVKQIKSLIEEFSVLSKKKPDDAVNKFKIKLINPVLKLLITSSMTKNINRLQILYYLMKMNYQQIAMY